MTLNFNDHLLQTPDGLLAALLGHLAPEVVLAAFAELPLLLLRPAPVLIRDVLVGSLLQTVNANSSASMGIIILLRSASGLVGNLLGLLLAKQLVLVVLLRCLSPDGLHIRNLVPGVVGSRLVDLR